MLPKKKRLNLYLDENNLLFSEGKRFHSPNFVFFIRKAKEFKISVVVSKKVAKNATDRNKIRRMIYSFFHDKKNQFLIEIIIIVKKKQLSFSILSKDLEITLKKIKKHVEKYYNFSS